MSIIIAMCLFSLSMSITPGPVNMIALTSGLQNGFVRSLGFVTGATLGFSLLLLVTGLGLNHVLTLNPLIMEVIRYLGIGLIIYMGWSIANASSDGVTAQDSSVGSFSSGFLLQWLNPKAWIACVSATAAFNLEELHWLVTFVLLYGVICYLSIGCWAFAGDKIQQKANSPTFVRRFNLTMGGALILTGLYLLV